MLFRSVTGRTLQALSAGPAKLIVRPEDIRVAHPTEPANAGAPHGQLAARVAGRQYLGAKTSYHMTLANTQSLRVDYSGVSHDAFAVGDKVMLALDPAKTLVLAS